MARVLIVDDDPGTLETCGAILRLAGHVPSLATNGHDGLLLARSVHPDLILADLRLSDISGLELLVELRAEIFDAAVVIITASGTRAAEVASRQLGAIGLVEKPIDEDVLLNLVSRHADRTRSSARAHVDRQPVDIDHAAVHWATMVMPIVHVQHDVPTVDVWARELGYSQAAIKVRCANAGVRASDSLDFARALRVVVRHTGRPCQWFSALEIIDRRTLARFLGRAALPRIGPLPNVETFLKEQRFISSPALIDAIAVTRSHADRIAT